MSDPDQDPHALLTEVDCPECDHVSYPPSVYRGMLRVALHMAFRHPLITLKVGLSIREPPEFERAAWDFSDDPKDGDRE